MTSLNGWVVRALLLSGVGLGFLGWGCASQQSTAQALAIAGTAAVIVGVSLAADGSCETIEAGAFGYCSSGPSKSTRQAGTALGFAGLGAAAVGYALQPKGPDLTRRPAPAPLPPNQRYRLIRTAPSEPDPPETEGAAEAAPEPEVAPQTNGARAAPPAGAFGAGPSVRSSWSSPGAA
jgi:hypothetical protein